MNPKSSRAVSITSTVLSRRQWLRGTLGVVVGASIPCQSFRLVAAMDPNDLSEKTFSFIRRCARKDGGYAPSPDPTYEGYSDTGLSDLAGVTYAATLA